MIGSVSFKDHYHSLPGPDNIVRQVLDNGLIVLVRENYTSPSVVIQGMFNGGGLLDSPDKAGTSAFYSSMLTRGTSRHTFEELFDKVEGMGASLDVGSSRHTIAFGAKSLSEDLFTILSLLGEVLITPSFPPDQMDKVRIPMLTGLKMREESTRHMANLKFTELLFENHPYSLSLNGYPETVRGITRDDLLAYHQKVGPRDGIIAISGAIDPGETLTYIEEIFGGWQNEAQKQPDSLKDAPLIDTIRKARVFIPGKSQSDLVLGYVGPSRHSPDFQPARLANSILGVFGMYGRLGASVRQREGLAYYSYSSLDSGLGPGVWRVNAGVAHDKVDVVVNLILDELRRLADEVVSIDEIEDNKSFFKGQIVLGLETNEGIAESLISIERYQLGLDYLLKYGEFIDAVTAEDIQLVARKYLNVDAYALSVAGSGE